MVDRPRKGKKGLVQQDTFVKKLTKTPDGKPISAHGADYLKPTRLVGTWHCILGVTGWPHLDRHLHYRGPLPKRCTCGRSHRALIGSDEHGFITAPTAAYPPGMCAALANLPARVPTVHGQTRLQLMSESQAPVGYAECRLMGKRHLFSDGHGLASPGRWPPGRRPCKSSHPVLAWHEALMSDLLKLLSERLDPKRTVCTLAAGKATGSPFTEELIRQGREIIFSRIERAVSGVRVRDRAERQPFFLQAIAQLLKLAGDPDWRQYSEASHSFEKGVPLGVDHRLPRTPALFTRKLRHRRYKDAELALEEDLRDNYASTRGHEERIAKQFEKEVALGAMVEMSLEEARCEFGEDLTTASIGAIPKADSTVRVVHDGTHGQHVNDRIRVRDAQRCPTGADLRAALESLDRAFFSLSGDISRAHRLVKVRRQDWKHQACRADSGDRIFLNTVGTFGVSSASYWWYRLMSGLGRLAYYCHGRDETTLLTYVDDLLWITQSGQGLWRVLGTIFLFVCLGTPMASHKFHGGQEHDWIGFSLFASQRWVGISQRRTDWLVNWFRKVRADGMVRVADMQAVLGRLSFAFSVLPTLRPFLGPVYAWVGAMQSRHVMPLPKALSLIFSFLEKALVDGYRVCEVPRATATTAEYFRTDARAEGSEMWIGGWCTADSKHPKQCRWFAEKLDHTKAAVFYMAGQSYRSIEALEMLASLVALLLFRPDQERKGSVRGVVNVCSAGTDNKGNTYVLARWLTTSFPLIAVLMEFSLVLADLDWTCSFIGPHDYRTSSPIP